MPGELQQQGGGERPAPSEQDKALAADWLKRIETALARPQTKEAFKRFEHNRKLLRGIDPRNQDKRIRSNLYFANLATMRPQVYAKDPEYAVTPTKAVPEERLQAIERFASTAETLLHEMLVKRAKLKKRAKRLLTSNYTTAVGWWKLSWQESPATDPLIIGRVHDTQDNLQQLKVERDQLADPTPGQKPELLQAKTQQTIEGLQGQAETKVVRALALDFVLSEDVVLLDDSIREISDYDRAGALAHRVWMTREQYRKTFGYDCAKGKGYTEIGGQAQPTATTKKDELLCVWEIWDQTSTRVFTVCDGEEGFCKAPFTPNWTGQRWYPLFLCTFNDVDGALYPPSDVELTEPLVREYNESRDDLVKDRRDARSFTVVRKGGSLTEEDVKNIRNRQGNDVIAVEGVGGQPIANDIQGIELGKIDPKVYDTAPARADMEMIVGGGDAARGAVLQAKTATEAEILSQGLRGRSAERQDTMEDLLTEVGTCALQMMLRKMSLEEVQRIAGPDAVWPSLTAEEVFDLVTVEVRGGSTGKPDRLQEQDRWTKLLPVIEKTVERVADLYSRGQMKLAQALIELLRETLRRFDERIDVEQYLPPAPEGEGQDPELTQQENQQLKQQMQELMAAHQELQAKHEKGMLSAATSVATSQNPQAAISGLKQAMTVLQGGELPAPMEAQEDPRLAELATELQAKEAELEQLRADFTAQMAKVQADADAKVLVGKHAADVDAQARVAIETYKADKQAEAQMATVQAQTDGTAQIGQLAELLGATQQQVAQLVEKSSAPKPKQKVVHKRDPQTNRLVSSHLVDEEPAGQE